MATLQTKTSYDTTGWDMGGRGVYNDDVTIKEDAGRSGDLLFLTILAMESAQKMIPLTDVNPALTSASLLCGANGTNAAGYIAVSDGSFQITIDGVALDITGLDFSNITVLKEVEEIINAALAGQGRVEYNTGDDVFTFYSNKVGLPESSITVLTAGTAGTDISGAGFLAGTAGAVTAATGEPSSAIPAGILGSNDIAEADIQAGDVDDVKVFTSGEPKYFNEDKIVLENSLTPDTVIPATGKTIRYTLYELGLVIQPTQNTEQIAPVN